MSDAPNQRGDAEVNRQAEGVWRQIIANPAMLFNAILTISSVLLFIATAVLAVTSIQLKSATYALTTETKGVKDATNNLVTATGRLADATDLLVKYAKEQGADMKQSIEAARAAAVAAESMANAANVNVQLMQEQISRDQANLSAQSAEIKSSELSSWGDRPIDAIVEIKNSGGQGAENVEITAKLAVASIKNQPCKVDATHTIAISIGPRDTYSVTARAARAITSNERQRVIDGSAAIFVFGKINYVDGAGKKKYRNFRFIYRGDIPSNFFGLPPIPTTYRLAHANGCNGSK